MEDLQRVASGLDSGAYSSQGDSSVAQEKSAAARAEKLPPCFAGEQSYLLELN